MSADTSAAAAAAAASADAAAATDPEQQPHEAGDGVVGDREDAEVVSVDTAKGKGGDQQQQQQQQADAAPEGGGHVLQQPQPSHHDDELISVIPIYDGGDDNQSCDDSATVVTITESTSEDQAASPAQHMPKKGTAASDDSGDVVDLTNLIVNYIPSAFDTAVVKAMFMPCGKIENIRLAMDRKSRRHAGYGFVKYATKEGAKRAIEKFDGFEIENKRLKVGYSRPRSSHKLCRLYVGGFPTSYTTQDLRHLFAEFEPIRDAKILVDAQARSRGVGFVRLSTADVAKEAISALHNTIPPNGVDPITVKIADHKEKERRGPVAREALPMLPPMPVPVPVPTLVGAAAYGYPASSAYAYPVYAPAASAYGPMRRRHSSARPSPIAVAPSPAAASSAAAAAAAQATNTQQQQQQPQQFDGCCLFVFHLPVEMQENQLQHMFSPYGNVVHVKVMRDMSTGRSKGFGFVNMSSYAEAAEAISALNGYAIGGKHLKVEFKKAKVEQQQQPQQQQQPYHLQQQNPLYSQQFSQSYVPLAPRPRFIATPPLSYSHSAYSHQVASHLQPQYSSNLAPPHSQHAASYYSPPK